MYRSCPAALWFFQERLRKGARVFYRMQVSGKPMQAAALDIAWTEESKPAAPG